MQTVQLSVDERAVAVAVIDLADRPMNVITAQLEADLAAVIERVAADAAIRGLVITSGKKNGFIGGGDLMDFVDVYGRDSASQVFERARHWNLLFRRLETMGKPVACAISGLALGGGLELALACHFRVLSEDHRAVVGLPEVSVGLLPGGGGTQRLPRLIGIAKALPLLLEGTRLGPREALELGLVHAVLSPAELVSAATSWVLAHPDVKQPWDVKGFAVPGGAGCLAPHATASFQAGTSRIAEKTQRNYPAPLAILSCVFEGTQVSIDTGLRIESKYFAKLLTGAVARNLMRTLFINKNAADKLSRRPRGIAKANAARIGVVGAGMMGAGIAYVAAVAGMEVTLLDESQPQAERGLERLQALRTKALERGHLDAQQDESAARRVTAGVAYDRLGGCDLVIEAVFESCDVKCEVFRRLQSAVNTRCVIATNTSTLAVTGLATCTARPADFIGLHFFSPVERMPLVEVIKGNMTSDETLARALDFVAQLRKTPIVANDSPGFFTSRIFGTYVDEGMAMLAAGIDPVLIENAARMAGMPTGPLAICDEVTIELQLRVHEQARADNLAPRFQRLTAINVVKVMVQEQGRIGRRGGGGFYDYHPNGSKSLWTGLRQLFPVATAQPEAAVLSKRFLTIQALETTRCLDEGVIEHPADADLGSVLGIGYPTWTGGVLSYIETVGLNSFVADCERFADTVGPRFAPGAAMIARATSQTPFYGESGETRDLRAKAVPRSCGHQ
jgi:3-hydroxyacyl-CoA dehydrogenase/enoyl-CoA hydratase/3-hydroxybutyryl-CoA epimerase